MIDYGVYIVPSISSPPDNVPVSCSPTREECETMPQCTRDTTIVIIQLPAYQAAKILHDYIVLSITA